MAAWLHLNPPRTGQKVRSSSDRWVPSGKRGPAPPEPCTQNPLWVPSLPLATAPPTHPLSGFPEEAHTHSSCRRGICRPCRCRSQRSCRSRLPGRENPAVSRGEDEPLQTSAGPSPSSWVSTSPGSSSPAQNRQKAHPPTPYPLPPRFSALRCKGYCLVFTPKDEPRLQCPFRKPGSDVLDLLSEPRRGNISSPPSLGNTEAWTEHWSRPRGPVTPA